MMDQQVLSSQVGEQEKTEGRVAGVWYSFSKPAGMSYALDLNSDMVLKVEQNDSNNQINFTKAAVYFTKERCAAAA